MLQIHKLCYAKKWETRVAAGQCIRLLAEHIQHCTPSDIAQKADASLEQFGAQTSSLLHSFDIASVLSKGRVLLQSGGEVINPFTFSYENKMQVFSSLHAGSAQWVSRPPQG